MKKVERGICMIDLEEKLDLLMHNLSDLLYQYKLCINLFERFESKGNFDKIIFDNHNIFLSYTYFCVSEHTILGFYKIFEKKGDNSIYKILSFLENNYKKLDKELELYFTEKSKEDDIYGYKKLDLDYVLGIESKINFFKESELFKSFKNLRDKNIAHNDINKGKIYFDFNKDLQEIYSFIFDILNDLKLHLFFGQYGDYIAEREAKDSVEYLFNELRLANILQDMVLDGEMKNKYLKDNKLKLNLDLNKLREDFSI